jgi:hypothetical protein
MLGDQISEETGKVLVIRVLDSSPLKAEVSIHTKGKLLGHDYQGRATYTSTMQAGGFLYGEGHGAYLTPGGDVATWIGQGTGKMKPGGGASYRGALHFRNATGKLEKLAGTVAVFEYETDASDNTTGKTWEWK